MLSIILQSDCEALSEFTDPSLKEIAVTWFEKLGGSGIMKSPCFVAPD
jgi:hypothetical protein